MAQASWRLEGEWLKNCSCAYGCHYEKVKLDGVKFAVTVDFPGPLHEGNGAMQPIIDERASAEQRTALFEIMSGKHSAEGTLFHIFSLIVSRIHDPVFAPIRWSFDDQGRKASKASHSSLARVVQTPKGVAA